MAAALAAEPVVIDFELTPQTGGEFYAYLHTEAVETERRLWLAFTQERSMLVPPLDYDDGNITCRIVGTSAELQQALAEVPDGLETSVERVGEFDSPPAEPRADLTDRQREVVETAVAVGYYRVPREATAAVVAAELDLDPSTVSEHLRKAEARLAQAFVGG
jgi:predicted DNA binding protein